MNGMEQFFTADKAEEGVEFPLSAPDGSETDHYLMVRGLDSDTFKTEQIKSRRKINDLAAGGAKLTEQQMIDSRLELLSCLISGWSFDEACTRENVLTFLKKAPQIADSVDELSANRRVFYAKK